MDHPDGSNSPRMPVIFAGHGSPMNAIEDNPFSRAWKAAGKRLPRPKAILSISAHWETAGTEVTAMERPRTIHDFGGFPPELYAMQYPAPGSPELAHEVVGLVKAAQVGLDARWGLDHGTWSVLCHMFPGADIPVVQLSLDHFKPPEWHYRLARELAPLRDQGVLIFGSGNIVHNLRLMAMRPDGFDWATSFDDTICKLILAHDHGPIIHYEDLGQPARLSIPTNEHYLPLLYVLAQQQEGEPVQFFVEGMAYGSLSMRSLWIG